MTKCIKRFIVGDICPEEDFDMDGVWGHTDKVRDCEEEEEEWNKQKELLIDWIN